MRRFRPNTLHQVILPSYIFDFWLDSRGIKHDSLQDLQMMIKDCENGKRKGICGIMGDGWIQSD